ncbi:MAG: fibronectin type III domain-containing protein, partial [Paracoccaceae bacterium]
TDPGPDPVSEIEPKPAAPTTKPTKVTSLKVNWKKKKKKAVTKWGEPMSLNAEKYQVRISKPNKTKKYNKWKSTNKTKHTFKNLKMKKKYKIQVRAMNEVGKGGKKGKKFKTKK